MIPPTWTIDLLSAKISTTTTTVVVPGQAGFSIAVYGVALFGSGAGATKTVRLEGSAGTPLDGDIAIDALSKFSDSVSPPNFLFFLPQGEGLSITISGAGALLVGGRISYFFVGG